ncbi:DUF1646 family protein [Bacillaceae bacterium Marseille-Q3522]|nr:DUF1646 family protein [Bacillaceae bacterium Marseille-Q3522]
MIGLIIILLLVLFLPLTVRQVENNLEIFLFMMGIAAAITSGVLHMELFVKALEDPIHITIAVLVAGLLCKWLQTPLEKGIIFLSKAMTDRVFLAVVVIVLGFVSSIITAIIAALVLVIIVSVLRLNRQAEIRFVILSCFSIGLGAALTPIGEPLSTLTISKLNEEFFYLFQLIGPEVVPSVIALGVASFFLVKPKRDESTLESDLQPDSYTEIFIRTGKIYLFIMGLTFLGAGFEPFIEEYLLNLHPAVLYWINTISAVLDNATLAAAEVSPSMSGASIQAILLGLLISGGMLIPGNIPNIISAGKLNITSKEWAQFGLPVGFILMIFFFIVLFLF